LGRESINESFLALHGRLVLLAKLLLILLQGASKLATLDLSL
jgi:hypothetical protein